MKKIVIRLTPELREQLKNALESNANEIIVSYEEELSEAQLGQVQGGATMVEYGLLLSAISILAATVDSPLPTKK